MALKIVARPNGPFRIECAEGEVEIVDINGIAFDLTGKAKIALCRCGGSATKPFCDGTHNRNGFQASELAPPKAQS